MIQRDRERCQELMRLGVELQDAVANATSADDPAIEEAIQRWRVAFNAVDCDWCVELAEFEAERDQEIDNRRN